MRRQSLPATRTAELLDWSMAEAVDEFGVVCCAVREQRILQCLFNDDGSPNKWWMCFSKKKFLGMELK